MTRLERKTGKVSESLRRFTRYRHRLWRGKLNSALGMPKILIYLLTYAKNRQSLDGLSVVFRSDELTEFSAAWTGHRRAQSNDVSSKSFQRAEFQ